MAGFVDNNNPSQTPVVQRIRDSVRRISTFGMKYDDMVIRNSQAVGITEAAFLNKNKSNVEDESMCSIPCAMRQFLMTPPTFLHIRIL